MWPKGKKSSSSGKLYGSPIEDSSLIGDCETAVLVSRHGSIYREVYAKGFNKRLNSFVQSYGSTQLDASCLRHVLSGFSGTWRLEQSDNAKDLASHPRRLRRKCNPLRSRRL
jgi:hypothetical protein